MNPNSHYYLSFDTGFPNAYDRAHGSTGSALMVHGTCSSMGCYAMTDRQAGEIYAIARDALKGGQAAFQMQAYPFHMSAENMALYRSDPNIGFWNELKEGSDRFEATGEILNAGVANKHYIFAPSADPVREETAKAFHQAELDKIKSLVAAGSAAIRTTYSDGGQNAIFAALMKKGVSLGTVSRPEALAYAGIDVTLTPAHKLRPTLTETAAGPQAGPLTKTALLSKAVFLAVHTAPVADRLDPAILAPKPLPYALFKPLPMQGVIAGASPVRAAQIVN